jgi:hypothetical protein
MTKIRTLVASVVISASAVSGVAVVGGVTASSLNVQHHWCCR